MFVVANWRRLEKWEVGRMDAYVMGLSRRMKDGCVCVFAKEGERERENEEK